MAGSPPRNRVARSAKVGGLVAGQSARWAGTRAANRLRSPEDADAATGERAAALARELVKQLGQLRGAAMKVGQVLSTIDFTAIPESEREEFKATLAALRDDVPPLPFKKVRKLLEEELGGPVDESFETFEEEAFAAASIGQVHRAITLDGDEVAVKLQYPGVAEAVDSDLRNLSVLLPLVKRLAPGLDVKALYGELRERIAEELDYEIEAQNHRAVERAYRGHPTIHVPKVHTGSRAAACSSPTCCTAGASPRSSSSTRPSATASREIVFRFYFSLLTDTGRVCGDPHPGNYLLLDDGRVGFLDFGLMRTLDPFYLEGERALARAVVAEDAAEVHAILARLGYLPDPADFVPGGAARVAAGGGRVVPAAGLPPALAPVRQRADRLHLLPALALVRAAAPADGPAAGAAGPAHGGARVLDARRAAGGRRLVRAGE